MKRNEIKKMNKLKLEVLIRSEVLPSLVLPFSISTHAAEYSDFLIKGKWNYCDCYLLKIIQKF